MSKNIKLAGLAAASIFAATATAHAGGFALREQSALGLGNAFAGAAAGGSGLASMFWNPATMTDFAGIQGSLGLFAIMPNSQITPTAATSGALLGLGGPGGSGDMAQDAALPSGYVSWQFADQAWVGLSLNTPFGLATQNPYNWSGQIFGRASKVSSMNATPTLGWRFNDQLSVGVGLQIMQFKVRLTTASSPVPDATSIGLVGEDKAFGFTMGATYKPLTGTEIGLGYRSQVRPKLDGTLNPPGVPIQSDMILPDQVTVGLRQALSPDVTVLAGFEWTHWSKFSSFPVTAMGSPVTALTFNYRDGWYASLGGEYKLTSAWTLRSGLAYEHSPVTDSNRSTRLPDSNRIWTTVGASYALDERMSFDASYAHLFGRNGTISNTVSGLTFDGTTKGRVDIFALGVNFKIGAEPKKVTSKAALVTK